MKNTQTNLTPYEIVVMTTAVDRPDLHISVFKKYKNYLKGANIKWVITINSIVGRENETELQLKEILNDFDIHIKTFPTGGTVKDFYNSAKYCINFAKEINPSKGYLWLEDDWEVNSGTFLEDLNKLIDTNSYVALVGRNQVSFNPGIWGIDFFNNHLYFNINNPKQSSGANRFFKGENTNPERICCPWPETTDSASNVKTIPRFKDVGRDWQDKNIKVRTFNVKQNLKNVVFIPNINLGNGRSNPYHYSIKSWEKWCDINDVQFFEWTEPITDVSQFKITLQRYWVHDILEHNGIHYDQVLIVDADTIIHPDTPNFFEETDGKFGVVVNNGCFEWSTRSINQWGDALFQSEPKIKPWKYFNGGFQITNKEHIPFYKAVQKYYWDNISEINEWDNKIKAGTDQTIINYLAQINGVDMVFMDECYNLQDLFRKDLLHIPGHSWFSDELHFIQCGWVYHFNAIPANNRDTAYWMERTYKELYEK